MFKLWLTRSTPAAFNRLAWPSFIKPSEQTLVKEIATAAGATGVELDRFCRHVSLELGKGIAL